MKARKTSYNIEHLRGRYGYYRHEIDRGPFEMDLYPEAVGFIYGRLDDRLELWRTKVMRVEAVQRPLHYINVVQRTYTTVRLAKMLYVLLAQAVALMLSAKASVDFGENGERLVKAGVFATVISISRWAKNMIVEARRLGKYSKRVELSLMYGSLIFIASEIFLFASLISASFDRFANQAAMDRIIALEYLTETNPLSMSEVWLATVVLVGSSAALNAYKAHYDSYDQSVSRLLNGRAVQLLGLGFVSIQLAEYVGNWAVIHLNSGAGAFFMVTGFHGLHVILGLILVIQQIEWAHREFTTTVNVGLYYSVIYWHFVDAVWLIVVMVIYVMQLGAELA